MTSRVLAGVGALAAIGLVLIVLLPRSYHDVTHVDGVVMAGGSPLAGAIVAISFPQPSRGGGARVISDSRGCFHLFARHSTHDRTARLSVRAAHGVAWEWVGQDARDLVAEVRLSNVGGRNGGGDVRQPEFPRDSALRRCHGMPVDTTR
ncbi:MAG: hypothetical protein IT361_02500 [Gemmatimonadaceae bacterium]|nr:hypothetical protein [Gemmatimonadaceae bacterium]